MERRYVFCGCQYPTSSGPSGNKSAWEWDIPTPSRKKKRISQSNPILATHKALDMESINKRYRFVVHFKFIFPFFIALGHRLKWFELNAIQPGDLHTILVPVHPYKYFL